MFKCNSLISFVRCNEICETYGYDSTFHGIGEGPTGSQDLGSCSQAAVLTRRGDKQEHSTDVQDGMYSLVSLCYQCCE
jgi:hypothetical protein